MSPPELSLTTHVSTWRPELPNAAAHGVKAPQSIYRSPRALLILVAFVAMVLGVGGLIGASNTPGPWFAALDKPFFNPPSWVFGPVWSVLYVMIGIAGWRIFMVAPKSTAMMLWGAQMLLNWAWSPVWFGLQWLWPALVIIVTLLVVIVMFYREARRVDRAAAWLLLPYAAWVSFATLLNLAIAVLNP